MELFQIRNWEKFQHYHKRNPPWIRLYQTILRERAYQKLSDTSRSHLVGLFLLASQHDNKIPADQEWLRHELCTKSPIDLKTLAASGWIEYINHDASNALVSHETLASCKQVAPESSSETEAETDNSETEADLPAAEKRAGAVQDPAANYFAAKCLEFTRVPYIFKTPDWAQLSKLRKAYGIGGKETPDGWEESVVNYFGSPRHWSIAELVKDYTIYRNSPTNGYNSPTNHKGNGNGKQSQADRVSEHVAEQARRLNQSLPSQDPDISGPDDERGQSLDIRRAIKRSE